MRLFTIAVVALAGLLSANNSLAAQRVTGSVREAAASTPIPGAVVSLLDSAGRLLTRTVSNAAGQYRLTGNGHGASVSAIRIGFRPGTKPLVGAGNTLIVADITLETLPAVLDAVAVHDQSLCPVVADGPAAFALWDQARTALLAEVVAREVNPATVRMVRYAKRMDARNTYIQEQAADDSVFVASQPVVSARTAAEFDTLGYRSVGDDSIHITYYGPDAPVLLDSTFLRNHCLSLRQSSAEHPDDIGIAFAPVRNHASLVDISGVLWLNRATPALRSLDFLFTNLTRDETRAGAGGTLLFTDMPNGVSMISRWNLHTPIIRRETTRLGNEVVNVPVDGPEAVMGFNDIGGQLAKATWPDGTTWLGDLTTVRGRVVASGGGLPLANAIVRFRGSNITAETDSMGAFAMPPTVTGRYVVEALDGLMAQLGISSTGSADILIEKAPVDDVKVVLPSRERSAESWCAKAARPTPASPVDDELLIGRVVFGTGVPAPDAMVVAQWTRLADKREQTMGFRARTNADGTFAMCGMPAGAPVTLMATHGSLASDIGLVTIDSLQHAAGVRLVLPNADQSKPNVHHVTREMAAAKTP